MAQIYRVLLRCPITLRVIDTGIRTSGRESLSSGAYEGGARCPECRQSHPLLPNAFFDLDPERLPHNLWRPNP
jgi:hypothetical protein